MLLLVTYSKKNVLKSNKVSDQAYVSQIGKFFNFNNWLSGKMF